MDEELVPEWLQFLDEFHWIYDYANTDILVENVLEKIPADWVESWAIHGNMAGMPESFNDFLSKCEKFSKLLSGEVYQPDNNKLNLNGDSLLGLSPKKCHEVSQLASFVQTTCADQGVHHVVDFGCGLGYLDRVLASEYEMNVLGLEQDAQRVQTAIRHNENSLRHCEQLQISSRLIFQALKIDNDSLCPIREILENWQHNNAPLGMVALHACGDLTVTMLKLFQNLPEFKMAVIVSCCYHRMRISESKFVNFPLSSTFQTQLAKNPAWSRHLRTFLFRLAAQETPTRTAGRPNEIQHKHMFYRALLQKYALDRRIALKKKRRRVVHEIRNDFPAYLDQVLEGYSINNDREHHRINLLALYQKYRSNEPSFALLANLQAHFQPVAESLLVYDRLCYCQESGLTATAVKVFNDFLSPRCWAIVLTR